MTRPESRNMRQGRRVAWMDEGGNHLRDLELDGGGRSCNGSMNQRISRRISWSAMGLLISEKSLAEGPLRHVDCASEYPSLPESRQGGFLSVGLSQRSQQHAPAVPIFMFSCFVQRWGSVVLCVIDLFTQVQRAPAACSFRSENRILLHKLIYIMHALLSVGSVDCIQSLALWSHNFVKVVFNYSDHTSKETHYVSATEPNQLMLFGETVAIYCENHTEHSKLVRKP
jgi:hypothetical protein